MRLSQRFGTPCPAPDDVCSAPATRRRGAWERGNPANHVDVTDHMDRALRVSHFVESVVGDVVTFTETTATRAGEPLRIDRTSLRFLDAGRIGAFLGEAGFAVEARYGDWSRGPLTAGSDDIVVVARAVKTR
ncbi:hypothetical protein [Streptomyces sp. NPDC088246]|uniref:hypothetical protein n=1 Tax=Streptomyces sp. NPDC088246 TaxID=3365842 RepID=UPI003809FAAA